MDFISRFDCRKKVLVVVDLEVGMYATLHQNARSAKMKRFFDFPENDVIRKNIGFGISFNAIERTEAAELLTHVRVIDVAIDDVTDHAVGVKAFANVICGFGKIQEISFLEKLDGFIEANSISVSSRVHDVID